MNFNLDEALKIANQVVCTQANRNLTDIEVLVLRGAWHREEYDDIAAKNRLSTSYIAQDIAPKLWKLLTKALGEKVRKSNFKEALKRHWEEQLQSGQTSLTQEPISDRNQQTTNLPSITQPPKLGKQHLFTPDFYVDRPPLESLCYETLLQPGSLIRIKAPKLMGKTYLMDRVLAQVKLEDYRTVSLSFKLADSIHFTHLNKFLRWFCINVSRELGLPSQLDEYWDEEGMGSKVSCTTYFEEYLLAQADNPLALCLDDVDLIFPYPEIYEDFFGLLRSWYEKARSRPVWKKLRIVIVHSTDVYIRLNINQSPFNVGVPIELSEFTREQVRDLAEQHGLDGNATLVESLMNWVGGHPFLLQQAFSHLKNRPDIPLEQLLAMAPTEAGIYSNHLREHWLTLQQEPGLAAAFKKVVMATKPTQLEPMQAYKLQSMGLVELQGNEVKPRCNLYRQYFCDRLRES